MVLKRLSKTSLKTWQSRAMPGIAPGLFYLAYTTTSSVVVVGFLASFN